MLTIVFTCHSLCIFHRWREATFTSPMLSNLKLLSREGTVSARLEAERHSRSFLLNSCFIRVCIVNAIKAADCLVCLFYSITVVFRLL